MLASERFRTITLPVNLASVGCKSFDVHVWILFAENANAWASKHVTYPPSALCSSFIEDLFCADINFPWIGSESLLHTVLFQTSRSNFRNNAGRQEQVCLQG